MKFLNLYSSVITAETCFFSLFLSVVGDSAKYIMKLKLIKQNLVKLADGYFILNADRASFSGSGETF